MAYPSAVVMVDGTGSSDESNWLIAGKRNNGAYQLKCTIFLDSHSIHEWLHVCLFGISSTVTGVDRTSC